jgi:hypothetical protein
MSDNPASEGLVHISIKSGRSQTFTLCHRGESIYATRHA